MNYYIFVLLSLIPYLPKNETFQNKILSSLEDRYSYYLTFNVSSTSYNGVVVIENRDFYYYCYSTKKMGKTKYVEYMKKILSNDETIYLKNVDLDKWSFLKVKFDPVIFSDAKRGKDAFTDKYFKNGFLRAGYSIENTAYIIYLLFKWKIAAKIDCESGYLFIYR